MKKIRTKPREWQAEFEVAAAVLEGEPGALEWATDDYVAFRYREPGVRIVFYPHRTSALNYHLRIRDEGSKDHARFADLTRRLYVGSGANCTFQMKNGGIALPEEGQQFGWAAQKVLGRSWV